MLNKFAACALATFMSLAAVPASQAQSLEVDDALCVIPGGWDAVAERGPDYVVFGEWHGTQESPAFLGSLACALARRGERILIAIEHGSEYDAAYQAAWALPEEEFTQALLSVGWAGREDGVASEAMFDLPNSLHQLKESGLAIDIVAFNGMNDDEQAQRFSDLPGQGPHEAAQAENIYNAARTGDFDNVLVLVGNLHAQKSSVDRGDLSFDPMVRRLSDYGSVVSLHMSYGTGRGWNCVLRPDFVRTPGVSISDDDIECGAHPVQGTAAYGEAQFIDLYPQSDGEAVEAYDGFFWVGPVSASAPKVPSD